MCERENTLITDLTIKTGSRLVQEEKELWLRSQLNTDGKQLALLDVETFTRYTDNSVGEVAHIQHLDDLFDIIILLLLADMLGLSQHGGEAECFANG